MRIKSIEWLDGKLRILDQTKLPFEEVFLEISEYAEVAEAIREMKIRGAPAIGVAAAYGLALGAKSIEAKSKEDFLEKLNLISKTLASTRPTARNLFWALERMNRVAQQGSDVPQIQSALLAEAKLIELENEEADTRISKLGAELIKDDFTILTHCNAGALATASYGTALGIIKLAKEQRKNIRVYVTETRPLLQGARLTTWELMQEKIPVTLIADTMTGYFLNQGVIDCVIVGADRIAANGDVANKIGTYNLAVLAKENEVPFYVAGPTSTLDLSLRSGDEILIEERGPEEIIHIQGVRIAPDGLEIANPAFDITPHRYVTAIITERGIIKEPYSERLRRLLTP